MKNKKKTKKSKVTSRSLGEESIEALKDCSKQDKINKYAGSSFKSFLKGEK